MPEPNTLLPLLAVLFQAPFAFRLGYVVRDGREPRSGCLFLALGGGTAALICFLSGSLLLGVAAALALTVLLAHARFLGAHRARSGTATAAAAPARTAAPTLEEGQPAPTPDALQAGMAFIGDMLETADRVGELRHKRRLRKLERQQAERRAAAPPKPAPAERRLVPRVRRDGPLWETKRLPPPE